MFNPRKYNIYKRRKTVVSYYLPKKHTKLYFSRGSSSILVDILFAIVKYFSSTNLYTCSIPTT